MTKKNKNKLKCFVFNTTDNACDQYVMFISIKKNDAIIDACYKKIK